MARWPHITPMPTPCREFQGPRFPSHYGRHRRTTLHNWIYRTAVGPVPPGHVVMHLCDNPPCFRLDHLQLGTIAENNQDKEAKGRGNHPPMHFGEANHAAVLTAADVVEIRRRFDAGDYVSLTALGREFGVARTTISAVCHRLTWADT